MKSDSIVLINGKHALWYFLRTGTAEVEIFDCQKKLLVSTSVCATINYSANGLLSAVKTILAAPSALCTLYKI